MHLLAALLSAFVLPGFTPAAAGLAGGQLLAGTFPATVRPGYVYLPPGFDPRRRYPVVYLLHGMPGSPVEYTQATQLATFADQTIAAGRMQPFIAVIPAAGSTARYNGEWAGQWESAVVSSIVPWVDANLPTLPEPRWRVLAGLSAGGFGAVDIALRHPGLFGVVESWSGYFAPLHDGPFANAGRSTLAAHTPVLLARGEASLLKAAGVRFFVSTGPSHSRRIPPSATLRFAAELHALGLPVRLAVYSSARDQWREQMDAGLQWALPGPPAPAAAHA